MLFQRPWVQFPVPTRQLTNALFLLCWYQVMHRFTDIHADKIPLHIKLKIKKKLKQKDLPLFLRVLDAWLKDGFVGKWFDLRT